MSPCRTRHEKAKANWSQMPLHHAMLLVTILLRVTTDAGVRIPLHLTQLESVLPAFTICRCLRRRAPQRPCLREAHGVLYKLHTIPVACRMLPPETLVLSLLVEAVGPDGNILTVETVRLLIC